MADDESVKKDLLDKVKEPLISADSPALPKLDDAVQDVRRDVTSNAEEIFIDEFGIERKKQNHDNLQPDLFNEDFILKSRRRVFENILEHKQFWPYFKIDEQQVATLLKVLRYLKDLDFGITPGDSITAEEMRQFDQAFAILSKNGDSEPYVVVQASTDPEVYYFSFHPGDIRPALKIGSQYYILFSTPDSVPQEAIQSRIDLLKKCSYFPDCILVEKVGKIFIARQFIPDVGHCYRGQDVSDFFDYCRGINFGPDTNSTNFKPYKGQVKYVDQDLIDWIRNPESNPFDPSRDQQKPVMW